MMRTLLSRMGLSARLLVAVTGGFVTLFLALGFLGMQALDQSGSIILQEQQSTARLAASEIDRFLAQAFYELDKATTFAPFDPTASDLSAEQHMLAHAYGRLGSFSLGVSFLDGKGRIVLSQPYDSELIGTDLSARVEIREALATGQPTVSAPFLHPSTSKAAVALTVPVKDTSGRVISLLSGDIDVMDSPIGKVLSSATARGGTAHADVVTADGTVVASTAREDLLKLGEHPEFYWRASAGKIPTIETVPHIHDSIMYDQHVMAFVPLAGAPWGLSLGASVEETFAPVNAFRRTLVFTGLLFFLLVLTLTLAGARMLVSPVLVLTQAARRMAGGDLTRHIAISEGAEIGLLASSLDTMRQQLRTAYYDLENANRRLEGQVKERTARLGEVLGKIISAQEEERFRLARELHDETAQSLGALSISLDRARDSIEAGQAAEYVSEAKAIATRVLEETRRLILDLRPMALDDLGLGPAIRWYVETHLEEQGVAVAVEMDQPAARLPKHIEVSLFRVVQEAVNNVAKHSNARHAKLRLTFRDSAARVVVADDGHGFDVERVLGPGASERSVGLLGMQERVRLLNGNIQIHSQQGKGTEIAVEIPIAEESR